MLDCNCGHPQGWHFRGNGSCLECDCMTYGVDKNETLDDILEGRSTVWRLEQIDTVEKNEIHVATTQIKRACDRLRKQLEGDE